MSYLVAVILAGILPMPVPRQDGQGPKIDESRLISSSATVDAINRETRMVTLRGPHGNSWTFKVDDSVKNLDKVKVGDKVVVDYYESMAVQVVKPGTEESSRETVVDSAEPGEQPAGAAAERTTIIATVEKIDHSAPSITLKDQDGNEKTIRVRHPERLKLVKVGDTLKITFQQAIAVGVEPAPSTAH